MVKLDLRALSAPLENLRPEVASAYKRLDAQWEAITATLKKLPIPCDIGCVLYEAPEDHGCYSQLEWRKCQGKKKVCIVWHSRGNGPYGYEETEEVTPYEEWSGGQRIEMLQHVPNLFVAAAKQTKEFIAKTRNQEGE